MSQVVPVLLPVPVDTAFDYLAPDDTVLVPGTFVRAPFGPRELWGVVWDERSARSVPTARLKQLRGVFDAAPMPAVVRQLVAQTAHVTLARLGSVLSLAMGMPAALEPPAAKFGLAPVPDIDPLKLTAARRRVVQAAEGAPAVAAELARRAEVGAGVVQGMVKAGLLHQVALTGVEPCDLPDHLRVGPVLSEAQAAAAAVIVDAVRTRRADVLLLDGVPGAGKTEVYLEGIAAALAMGRRAIVLLPEIALTAQWLDRFQARFGAEPAVWHSGLAATKRRRIWRNVAEGRLTVVVGARSALFMPLLDVGLIVVDEEHDPSFKQEDGVAYSARDAAIARARLEGCPIVLASATPSIEMAAQTGMIMGGPAARAGHAVMTLPARFGGAALPAIALVDLRAHRPPRGGFLSPPLRQALAATLDAGEQAMLFLNRRGYAPLTLCRACGHRIQCPNCSSWLVAHRLRGRLQCHHCGYGAPEPAHCPACGVTDALALAGPGVERIAEEAAALLPGARLAVMTSDTIRSPEAVADIVHAMTERRLDLLIGTQIVAKGHHFPGLTLVGAVDADLGLSGGDLRAAERSFQLLYQVSGRAGRAAQPGRVLIQTHVPHHPLMQALAAGDRDRFLEAELAERRLAGMPPFGRLAALILSGPDASIVKTFGRELARSAPPQPGVTVLGPAPAPLALLRGRYRERLLVKTTDGEGLVAWLRGWLGPIRVPSALRLQVDVDPQSFQ